MAQVISQVSIPSSKGNRIYDIVAYDNGVVTCTCPGGRNRGQCKHIREYKEQASRGPVPETMAAVPSFTPDNPIRKEIASYHIYFKDERVAYVHLERVYTDADDTLKRDWSWQLLDGETTGEFFNSSDAAADAVISFLGKE